MHLASINSEKEQKDLEDHIESYGKGVPSVSPKDLRVRTLLCDQQTYEPKKDKLREGAS